MNRERLIDIIRKWDNTPPPETKNYIEDTYQDLADAILKELPLNANTPDERLPLTAELSTVTAQMAYYREALERIVAKADKGYGVGIALEIAKKALLTHQND